MTDKFTGKVEGIEPKVGYKDGKPWSLYLMEVSGAKFVTFNELVIKGIGVGDEVVIEYEVKKKSGFESNSIINIRKKSEVNELKDVLKENIVKVDGKMYKVVFIRL